MSGPLRLLFQSAVEMDGAGAEMVRVTKPGGTVAAYAWDIFSGFGDSSFVAALAEQSSTCWPARARGPGWEPD